MDEPPNDTLRQKEQTNKLAKMRAIELRAQGWHTQQIADELGVARQTVSRWINSLEAKEMVELAMQRLRGLLMPAIDVYALAISKASQDMNNGLKAAKDVTKTFGVVKDSTEISHQFPKATVIKRSDGTEVVLGAVTEKVVEGKEE